ncbi:MAG: GNAT family N-acetyltransferase [Actinomycetota bacterium]|nr:GNAT family N-acetyltransferase [Actinomycetota bacterium]
MSGPRLLNTEDVDEWEQALPASRSAFGSLGFARVQERSGDVSARLLVSEGSVTPLLLRPISDTELYDATTPPFTGPIGAGPSESLEAEGIVTEFDHLHPWDAAPPPEAEADREIVWVDTTQEPEQLRRESFTKAARKNLKRSEEECVDVYEAESAADVAEFHRIYIQTMERNDALRQYFFEVDYFQAIFQEMRGSARFLMAAQDGVVVAATLYLQDAESVYSYLGGADHAYQHLRPTNAVVSRAIERAHSEGKKRLILGGGYTSDDGIFRFKASFSPLRATLRLARRVHRPEDFERLAADWRERNPGVEESGFFPPWRQVG